MENTIMVHAGRQFSPEEIELIKWTRAKYKALDIKELAETVCEFLDWKTNSGKIKTKLCIEYMRILVENGIISMPNEGRKKVILTKPKKKVEYDASQIIKDEMIGKVSDFEPIKLEIVRSKTEEIRRWKHYVSEYHMLGYKGAYGAQLFYFIKSGDRELGCIQFSAAAWALECREKWIGWDNEMKKKNLFLIINNSRYLIFPWIKIKYLASKVLSIVAKQIQKDWMDNFYYEPVLLETFVDLEHFKGTCYKAANWECIGITKGRGKMDREHEKKLSKKAIFTYPLERNFKDYLSGEKPHKTASEDDRWW